MSSGISTPSARQTAFAFQHRGNADRAQLGLRGDPIQPRIGQRRDRIEAHIAPELQPDVPADAFAHRRFKAGGYHRRREGRHAFRPAAVRLAQREAVEMVMLDNARTHGLAGGIDHASDGALRTDQLPLPRARVDRFERPALQRSAVLVEIPPRNTVHRRDEGGVVAQKGREERSAFVRLLRLERADHVVLRTELARIVARRNARDLFLAFDPEPEPAFPDCLEVSATGDHADIISGERQFDREIATDGASAKHADLHCEFPLSQRVFRRMPRTEWRVHHPRHSARPGSQALGHQIHNT